MYLERLREDAKKALKEAHISEMVYTMFNLEAHYCERKEETLRRVRAIFPTIDWREEAENYETAYKRLRAFCVLNNLY